MRSSPQLDPRDRDATLIAALRTGDDMAARDLYDQYHPRCVFFLRRWSGDDALARELAAEAMSRLLVKAASGGVREPRGFAEFAFTLTRNIWKQYAERITRERRHLTVVDPDQLTRHADDRDPDRAYTAAMAIERRRDVDTAMSELPPRYREILELRFGEGLSHNAIAGRLDVDPANARQLLSRARERFRIVFRKLAER